MKIIDPDTAGQRETIEYCVCCCFLNEITRIPVAISYTLLFTSFQEINKFDMFLRFYICRLWIQPGEYTHL